MVRAYLGRWLQQRPFALLTQSLLVQLLGGGRLGFHCLALLTTGGFSGKAVARLPVERM
jgi:hypothetical protein